VQDLNNHFDEQYGMIKKTAGDKFNDMTFQLNSFGTKYNQKLTSVNKKIQSLIFLMEENLSHILFFVFIIIKITARKAIKRTSRFAKR
jgi:hypothetical protein